MGSPTVDKWLSNRVLLNRASTGILAIIPRNYLTRSDLICNQEILIPLIKFHGLRIGVDAIALEVERFFNLGRPSGAKPIGSI